MLAEALGLYGLPQEDCEALNAGAARFLRAGGRVTLTEWLALSTAERTVLAQQGDTLRAQQALDVADALASDEGRAEVAAEVDGGESLVNLKLGAFLEGLA